MSFLASVVKIALIEEGKARVISAVLLGETGPAAGYTSYRLIAIYITVIQIYTYIYTICKQKKFVKKI